jgi:hypothetical protein
MQAIEGELHRSLTAKHGPSRSPSPHDSAYQATNPKTSTRRTRTRRHRHVVEVMACCRDGRTEREEGPPLISSRCHPKPFVRMTSLRIFRTGVFQVTSETAPSAKAQTPPAIADKRHLRIHLKAPQQHQARIHQAEVHVSWGRMRCSADPRAAPPP